MRIFLFLVTLLSLVTPADAAAPATQTTKAEARPTREEALTFLRAYSPSALRREAEIRTLRREFVKGIRRDPGSAQMLDAFPGLGEALTEAMASQIDVYIAEYDERFFPRAAAIVEQAMSRADVARMTAFYASPLGRKALASTASKIDVDEVMQRAVDGKNIDMDVARRQALRAGMATYSSLSEEERNSILAVARSAAGRRFQLVVPKLLALQVELTNSPGPKFEAGSKAAMGAAFKRITGQNPLDN